MISNNDPCLYCEVTRGELRVQKRANHITMPCVTKSQRHRFVKPKRKEKIPIPENQLAFNLFYEDI